MTSVSKIAMIFLLVGIGILLAPIAESCNFATGCSMVPVFAAIPFTWNGVTSTPSILGFGLLVLFVDAFLFVVWDPLGAWRKRSTPGILNRLSQISIRGDWFILALIGALMGGGVIGAFTAPIFHQTTIVDFVSIYGPPTISTKGGSWINTGGRCTIIKALNVDCKTQIFPSSNITITVNLVNNAPFTIYVLGYGQHNSSVITPQLPTLVENNSIVVSGGFVGIHFPFTFTWHVPSNTAGEVGADFIIIFH